MKMLSKWG